MGTKQYVDLHPYSISVHSCDATKWYATIRTPTDTITGEFCYGSIEDIATRNYVASYYNGVVAIEEIE